MVTKESTGNTQLVASSAGDSAACCSGALTRATWGAASLGSSTAPGRLILTVLRLVGVGPSSSSIGGMSSRAVLPSDDPSDVPSSALAWTPLGATLIVAASVGFFSLIVLGPSPGFEDSSVAKAASREMRDVLRFSSTWDSTAAAGGLIDPAPILTAGAVAGLILIVFGPSVEGFPSEVPGLGGAAISSGILEVSFLDVSTVFTSADGAGATPGFVSGTVIRMVLDATVGAGGLIAMGGGGVGDPAGLGVVGTGLATVGREAGIVVGRGACAAVAAGICGLKAG